MEYVTAPLPDPPDVLKVVVPPHATVVAAADTVRVDWLVEFTVTVAVLVAAA